MNMQTFTSREPEDYEVQTESEFQLTTLSFPWLAFVYVIIYTCCQRYHKSHIYPPKCHNPLDSSTKYLQLEAFYIPGHVEVYQHCIPETILHTYNAVYQVRLRDLLPLHLHYQRSRLLFWLLPPRIISRKRSWMLNYYLRNKWNSTLLIVPLKRVHFIWSLSFTKTYLAINEYCH